MRFTIPMPAAGLSAAGIGCVHGVGLITAGHETCLKKSALKRVLSEPRSMSTKPPASPSLRNAYLPLEVFRQAVAQADVAISITNLDADIIYVNEAFSRVTGYGVLESIGQNESMLSSHATPHAVYGEMWTALMAGKPWTGRLLNQRKGGEQFLAELTITPVLDAGGNTLYYLGMQRDVSDLHRLALQVKNQKTLIESVIDNAPVALALLDADGQVQLDNQEYKRLSALLDTNAPAMLLLEKLQPDWRDRMLAAKNKDVGEGKRVADKLLAVGFSTREVRIDRPGSAAPRWFSCAALPIAVQDERTDDFYALAPHTYLLLVVSDVSALRRGQEKARLATLRALMVEEEHAAALRESLSAALFRLEGPLNVMDSIEHVLQHREPGMAEGLHAALKDGRTHLESLRQLIPQGCQEAMSPVNLNEALRDVLDVCTPRLLANGISIHWQPDAVLPAVLGRPMLLRSLFKALLDNAIDALSMRGWKEREISIVTSRAKGQAQVSIDDSGPGIPAELRFKVFEPFFTTRGTQNGHLGTGLARAQEAVAGHGGILDLLEAPGGGCRARVELPLAENNIEEHAENREYVHEHA
ncbi:MAG: nitrogen fixation negative regulator NifL [Zoogloeaceae bacterium]|jgi:nitrogen fixation negative regulator NifL|nr:nitrogen fixation negative regulator NifL [Zoogloeaceae bacterium]